MPGQPGNVALAGHRTTYQAPFARLDELQPGDEITFETVQGTFTYTVDAQPAAPGDEPSGHFIVKPTQVEILEQDGTNKVTLMACHPKYSARERIVVTGTLTSPPAPPTPLPEVTGDDAVTVDASLDAPGRRRSLGPGAGDLLDRAGPADLVPDLAGRPQVAGLAQDPRLRDRHADLPRGAVRGLREHRPAAAGRLLIDLR